MRVRKNRVVDACCVCASVSIESNPVPFPSTQTLSFRQRFFYQQLEKPLAPAYDLADYTMSANIVARDTEVNWGSMGCEVDV